MKQAVLEVGAVIRAARKRRRLTQRDVAEMAGVTQPHVSMIERGLDAHVSVLQKVASAVGLRLSLDGAFDAAVEAPYGDDEIANRLYQLGRLASHRVSADSLAQLRTLLDRAVARHGDRTYFRAWRAAVEEGPSAVSALLSDPTEYGRYMRAVATMRPFVTQEERDAFYRPTLPRTA